MVKKMISILKRRVLKIRRSSRGEERRGEEKNTWIAKKKHCLS